MLSALDSVEASALIVAVFTASLVQINVGFGFSLLSVPLMTVGLRTQDAVVISTFLGLVTNGLLAWNGRRVAEWHLVRRLTVASLLGIPFGLIIFKQLDANVLKVVLGVGILIATYLLIREVDFMHRGPAIEWSAGFLSGALASSLSTNGPPLVIALQGRKLGINVFRSTISVVFVVSGVVTLLAFIVTDEVRSQAVTGMILAIPALGLGIGVGLIVRRKIDDARARVAVLILLTAAGLLSIVTGILQS